MNLFNKIKILILILAASFFSYNSLIQKGYIPMHDDMQPIRLLQIDKCLKDGQIPCRWTPDLGYGYGYPLYIFYSPLIYYLMEIIHLVGFSLLTSIKISFILSFIFSGISMFLLGRLIWGNLGGLVSSAFYIYAPFRAADVYSRGAVGEFWAMGFLPLILWSILKIFKQKYQKRNLIYISLSFALLLLTHNLTSVSFAPILLLWIIGLLFIYQNKKIFIRVLMSLVVGFLISGFYTIPLVFERGFVHLDTMISGYFNYLAHFVSFGQLFLRNHWGFGSSELGSYDDLSFSIGTIHWVILIVSTLLFIKTKQYFSRNLNTFIIIFTLIVFITSVFLTHSRSTAIWQIIDPLKYFQFPWRFLIYTALSTSIIAGYPVYLLNKNKKTSLMLALIMIFVVIVYNARLFRPQYYIQINDHQKLTGANWQFQQTASIYDYLPINVKSPPASKAPEIPTIIHGQAEILTFTTGTNWQKGTIQSYSMTSIQLPLYYYPGMLVTVDGQKVDYNYQNDLALITFDVPPGLHSFEVMLTQTTDQIIGNIFTIIGILILLFYV